VVSLAYQYPSCCSRYSATVTATRLPRGPASTRVFVLLLSTPARCRRPPCAVASCIRQKRTPRRCSKSRSRSHLQGQELDLTAYGQPQRGSRAIVGRPRAQHFHRQQHPWAPNGGRRTTWGSIAHRSQRAAASRGAAGYAIADREPDLAPSYPTTDGRPDAAGPLASLDASPQAHPSLDAGLAKRVTPRCLWHCLLRMPRRGRFLPESTDLRWP